MSSAAEFAEMGAAVRYLQDRQAILDCIVREARGRDRQDVALTLGCYWPEGIDEHGPVLSPAPEYPARANAGHAAFFAATSHSITSHLCEIDGDTAWCESYVVGGLLAKDGKTCKISPGRYIDRLERRGGEWRILHRRTVVDMALEGDATWLESPAIRGFLKGAWGEKDVSYQRPVEPGGAGPRWQAD